MDDPRLIQYSWFHPVLSGPDAMTLLNSSQVGSFLCRFSSKHNALAISYKDETTIHHSLICYNEDGFWIPGQDVVYCQLDELIRTSSVMKFPIPRDESKKFIPDQGGSINTSPSISSSASSGESDQISKDSVLQELENKTQDVKKSHESLFGDLMREKKEATNAASEELRSLTESLESKYLVDEEESIRKVQDLAANQERIYMDRLVANLREKREKIASILVPQDNGAKALVAEIMEFRKKEACTLFSQKTELDKLSSQLQVRWGGKLEIACTNYIESMKKVTRGLEFLKKEQQLQLNFNLDIEQLSFETFLREQELRSKDDSDSNRKQEEANECLVQYFKSNSSALEGMNKVLLRKLGDLLIGEVGVVVGGSRSTSGGIREELVVMKKNLERGLRDLFSELERQTQEAVSEGETLVASHYDTLQIDFSRWNSQRPHFPGSVPTTSFRAHSPNPTEVDQHWNSVNLQEMELSKGSFHQVAQEKRKQFTENRKSLLLTLVKRVHKLQRDLEILIFEKARWVLQAVSERQQKAAEFHQKLLQMVENNPPFAVDCQVAKVCLDKEVEAIARILDNRLKTLIDSHEEEVAEFGGEYCQHPETYPSLPPYTPSDTPCVSPMPARKVERCKALYPYTAKRAGQIDIEKGDIIRVLRKKKSGWWEGDLNGKRGKFPSNYVTVIDDPHVPEVQKPPEVPRQPPATDEVMQNNLESEEEKDMAQSRLEHYSLEDLGVAAHSLLEIQTRPREASINTLDTLQQATEQLESHSSRIKHSTPSPSQSDESTDSERGEKLTGSSLLEQFEKEMEKESKRSAFGGEGEESSSSSSSSESEPDSPVESDSNSGSDSNSDVERSNENSDSSSSPDEEGKGEEVPSYPHSSESPSSTSDSGSESHSSSSPEKSVESGVRPTGDTRGPNESKSTAEGMIEKLAAFEAKQRQEKKELEEKQEQERLLKLQKEKERMEREKKEEEEREAKNREERERAEAEMKEWEEKQRIEREKEREEKEKRELEQKLREEQAAKEKMELEKVLAERALKSDGSEAFTWKRFFNKWTKWDTAKVDRFAEIFSDQGIEEEDELDHELLLSMGITRARERLDILKAKKESQAK